MIKFWNFLLTKSLPADSLSNLRFSVFGFGDSSYRKYNVMARMLFQRLQQLGASVFHERGLGDDKAEGGYSLSLIKWKKNVFEKFSEIFGPVKVQNTCYSGLMNPPKPVYTVIQTTKNVESISKLVNEVESEESVLSKIHKKNIQKTKLISNDRITTSDHFQDVREVVIEKDSSLEFSSGDICTVFPSNFQSVVEKMLVYYQLDKKSILDIKDEDGYRFCTTTAGHLFNHLLDLSSPPKFFFFKMFSFYTDLQIYKEKIQEMGK